LEPFNSRFPTAKARRVTHGPALRCFASVLAGPVGRNVRVRSKGGENWNMFKADRLLRSDGFPHSNFDRRDIYPLSP